MEAIVLGKVQSEVVSSPARPEIELTENALAVLERRYVRKGSGGQPIETVGQVFHRVASHIAAVEEEWGGDVVATEALFYDLVASLRFMPNSPTFTGAGTPLGQLAACFVLSISDDMGREEDGIFQTLRDTALIQQTGGGTGFSFSRLRPRGAVVRSSGGQATGPVGFMRVFDTASEIVSQGGARRGANMAVLRVDHPDIHEFIHCKSSENAITNFNISVGATDGFMQAVEEDGTLDLVNPQDGEVWGTARARELFDEIVAGAHRNGEPGMLFLDAANRDNPCPHLGEYEASNPCGEQFLLPYENCCLGSINLARHVQEAGDKGQETGVDWEKLAETVAYAVRFLDDVIEANAYVSGVPQLKEAARRTRRIGLGIMGLGDLLYQLRVRYGSDEGQELAAQVIEFIRYHAMRASIELARERGPFPAIQGSLYDPDDLRWAPPQPLVPYTRLEQWGRPALDWGEIVEGIRRHGIRNSAQTTVAPTGTVATVAGCEAYGCEPVFALAYTRHVNDNGNDLELRYVSP
ncbi:MAG: adenosylcobalamin-dependent ribonucleoside-diphosphate reductase, partial [Chloroflexi bacterium]|nr:adenosylcobalamin-dependent ribonucleoside-diphosphate reductase [Chloroflexota bacterium]